MNKELCLLKTGTSRLNVIYVFYQAGILVAYSIHVEWNHTKVWDSG